MQTKNPWAVVGLSIITFGIYHIYWLADADRDLKKLGYENYPSWPLYFAYLFSALAQISEAYPDGAAILINLASLAGVGYIILWLYKFAEALSTATKGYVSKAAAFIAPLLIQSLGDALIQNQINKYASGDTSIGIQPNQQNQPVQQNNYPQQHQPQPPQAPSQQPQNNQNQPNDNGAQQ